MGNVYSTAGKKPQLPACMFLPFWFKLKVVTYLLIVILVGGCGKKQPAAIFSTPAGPRQVLLEVVETEQDMAKGLMFRQQLEEDHGMLFVYKEDVRPTFWMKNTYLSLDILFLTEDGILVDLFEQVPPCPMRPCPTYTSRFPCRYVLEVKGGYTARYHIRKGARVQFRNLEDKAKKTAAYTAGEQKGKGF